MLIKIEFHLLILLLRVVRFSVRLLATLERALKRRSLAPRYSNVRDALQLRNVVKETEKYDMAEEVNEWHYRKQYWHVIEKALQHNPDSIRNLPILDIGCGQGRLMLLLAKWCLDNTHSAIVHGVDISPSAVAQCKRNLSDYVSDEARCMVNQGNALEFLKQRADASVQAIICTEVFFILPEYKQVMTEAYRVLAPGGIFLPATRSRQYYIWHAVAERRWDALPFLLGHTDGMPFGAPDFFSWATAKQIAEMLEDRGFKIDAQYAIGSCSGISGDPLAILARPEELDAYGQQELLSVECEIARSIPDIGRYVLSEARR